MDRIRERHIRERSKRTREVDEPTPELESAAEQPVYPELTDHYEGDADTYIL